VPLSDEEMRLLEQMERALVEEDPKFASTLRGTTFARATRTRIIAAAAAFVVGIVVLMTGAVMQLTIVGIVGFVVMLASATVGLSAWRGRQATSEKVGSRGEFEAPDSPAGLSLIHGGRPSRKPRRGSGGAGSKPKQGLMRRLEQRWQRRRDQNGY